MLRLPHTLVSLAVQQESSPGTSISTTLTHKMWSGYHLVIKGYSQRRFLVLLCFPELLSPSLDSETKVVMRGQNVSLICSNQNKSLQITYFLFWREKHLRTHDGKSEPMIFNLSISEAHELGPYKCKAQVSNCSVVKYSREFNFVFVGGDGCPFCLQLLLPGLLLVLIVIILVLAFWILPKYKASEESARGLEPRQCVPTAQDGTGCSQGILYATPVFQKAAPRVHEACNDCKTGYIYSELIF
ncbi:allergin-1 isoform X3 [Mirounga leonina]|uniref:allergin-1 isoform X3 n=1 Tax=Mirounga leonina TaxID=9715 RepID=UPI00156C4AEB|nr:allergin-1 isoform X3 [Mirounga leonina]